MKIGVKYYYLLNVELRKLCDLCNIPQINQASSIHVVQIWVGFRSYACTVNNPRKGQVVSAYENIRIMSDCVFDKIQILLTAFGYPKMSSAKNYI